MDERPSDGLYAVAGLPIVDGDRVEVLGPPAGPAGVSAVELPDGSVWEVDHLNPTIPVRLEVAADDPAGTQLLLAAFGGDGALFLVDRIGEVAQELHSGVDVDQLRPPDDAYGRQSLPRSNDAALRVGRLVLLADLSGDLRAHPLARIAAAVEFASTHEAAAGADLLQPLHSGAVVRAESLADDIDTEEIALLDADTASRLATACLRAAKGSRSVDSRLFRLGRRIDAVAERSGWPGERGSWQGAAVRAVADQLLAPDVVESRSAAELADGDRQVDRLTPTLVRVTVARSDTQRWIRLLHRDGLVLLAQAPLRRDGLVDVADLVVPPGVDDDDLHVQVVHLDGLDVLAGRPVELIRAAVQAGRDAARAARVHNRSAAAVRWQRCAALWEQVGDVERARQATDLVGGHGSHLRQLPFLADEVAEPLLTRS